MRQYQEDNFKKISEGYFKEHLQIKINGEGSKPRFHKQKLSVYLGKEASGGIQPEREVMESMIVVPKYFVHNSD